MNTVVTSRAAILKECRKLVMKQGITAINMRTVAAACNIAVGSLYNYFPSKVDLINATIEDVWKDIFHMSEKTLPFHSFIDCLSWLYQRIQNGCIQYPGFFTFHSMNFATTEKEKGKKVMEHYCQHIKYSLLDILNQDQRVRKNAFDDAFTKEVFIDVVFDLLLSMLLQHKTDCHPLLTIIQRTIY